VEVIYLRTLEHFKFNFNGRVLVVNLLTGDMYYEDKLSEEDLLIDEKDYEEIINIINKRDEDSKGNYSIVPTYGCNFRCTYCYEEDNVLNQLTIDTQQIDCVFNTIKNIEKDKEINITLIGGEPLLKENYKIIEYIIGKISAQGYSYNIVTNGYDLCYFIDLLKGVKPNYIQITIDGLEEIHDQRRNTITCDNTFRKIMENVQLSLDANLNINIRTNVDEENLENLPLLATFLRENYLRYPNFNAYLYMISDGGCLGTKNCVDEVEAIKRIINMQKNCPDMSIFDWSFHGMEFLNSVLDGTIPKIKSRFCSACANQFIFSPDNKIYKCLFGIGDTRFSVGTYYPDLLMDRNKVENWKSRNISNMKKCKLCKFKFLCAGGCANKSMKYYGDIYQTSCPNFKGIFKEVLNYHLEKRGDII
jgi:uncharacterized protein